MIEYALSFAIGATSLAGLALGQWRQIEGSYQDLQGIFNA